MDVITLADCDDITLDDCRGHTVRAVTESFQMSKDAGFKVVAHMMPDLPNVDIDRDVDQFIVSIISSTVYTILH